MPSSGQVVYDAQQVLECYGDLVLRTAFMMLKNRADAEDAAQDVFLSFIRTKPVFAGYAQPLQKHSAQCMAPKNAAA